MMVVEIVTLVLSGLTLVSFWVVEFYKQYRTLPRKKAL